MFMKRLAVVLTLLGGLLVSGVRAQTPVPAQTPDQRVAALKKSLAESQASLRKFEWIETTVLSLKGEEKSRKQLRCYYGADGKVQKLPIADAAPAAAAQSGGRRGGRAAQAIVAKKKDEMQDYMESAVALVHQYLPPSPERIQKSKDAGKVAVVPQDQGRVRLDFSDYLLPGDRMSITVNAATSSLAALTVATYLEKKDDVVALDVQFGTLTDGTSYTAKTTLDAKAKNVRVVVTNTGHKPLGTGTR
jgi:hypothetical protein